MARGQQHDRKPRLRPREDRRALAPDGVEHRHQPVGPGLHRRTVVDRHRVGASAAKEIGQDEAAERGQPVQVARHRGLVPQQVDRERRGGHEEKIGAAVPDDLVREVGVAVPRVERLRSARHAVSMARRAHTMTTSLKCNAQPLRARGITVAAERGERCPKQSRRHSERHTLPTYLAAAYLAAACTATKCSPGFRSPETPINRRSTAKQAAAPIG